jgi:hypothetical protein
MSGSLLDGDTVHFQKQMVKSYSSGSQVAKLVLVNAQGYAEGTGKMATFPRFLAYAGVTLLTRAFFVCWTSSCLFGSCDILHASSYVVYSSLLDPSQLFLCFALIHVCVCMFLVKLAFSINR